MEESLQQFWLYFSAHVVGEPRKSRDQSQCRAAIKWLGLPSPTWVTLWTRPPILIGQRVLSRYPGKQKGGGWLFSWIDQKPEPSVLIVGWRIWLPTFRQILFLWVSMINILPWWLESPSTSCSSVLNWKLRIFKTCKSCLPPVGCPKWEHNKWGPCSSRGPLAYTLRTHGENHVSEEPWERKGKYYQGNAIFSTSQVYLLLG